ncbi:hypothetical protein [Frankia sp. R43]|uniref:hypothetical protein n=1 Tax=Frankia sp. R43 TaxID=269536 RepID=UPI00128F6B79|nr:hypothetical protein [Frankia sp. R43]
MTVLSGHGPGRDGTADGGPVNEAFAGRYGPWAVVAGADATGIWRALQETSTRRPDRIAR